MLGTWSFTTCGRESEQPDMLEQSSHKLSRITALLAAHVAYESPSLGALNHGQYYEIEGCWLSHAGLA